MSLAVGVVCAQTSQPSPKEANEDVLAIVLGKKLTVKDQDKLNGLIFGSLLDQFAKDNQIEPTEEELDSFVLRTEEKQQQHLVLQRDFL